MRVALVSRELYPFVGGGIAPIVAAAARQLSGAAEVALVTSAAHREEHRRLQAAGDPRLPPPEVEMVWVEEPDPEVAAGGGHMSYMHHYTARVHHALKEHYGRRGPDLIEFCDYLGEGFVTVQARQTAADWLEETLVCVRLHTTAEICNVLDGYLPDDFASVAVHDAERFVLRNADRVLWPGGDVLETYRRYYGPAGVAPGVRIPDAFLGGTPAEDGTGALPVPGEPLRLLYVGRMERRKGVQNLVRAVTSLERDDWTLTMIGGDTGTGAMGSSLTGQLELMVAGDDRIALLGPVARDQVEAHLRAAHVVVMPSLWECWPNAAREALMLNRPLLATRVGGLSEMAQPGRSGWLVTDSRPDSLRAALDERLWDVGGTMELIQYGRPRDVFDELTDPEALVRRYTELAGGRTRRRRPASVPLASIVVPYFRLDDVVEETLRSALDQTYPNLEVLLVVDGSLREEDRRVLDLADELGVRVVVQPNSGLSAARNFGISQARGTYVLPLDADDVIEPSFVSRCVAALEADPGLAYVTTGVQYMAPDGTPIVDDAGGYMPLGNWSRLIERNNVGGTCSAVFRRSLFDDGFCYSPDLTSYEDWLLYLELHRAGHHGGVIPERLLHYRVRGDSMMRTVGAPGLQRIAGEVRALAREQATRWAAENGAPAGLPSGGRDTVTRMPTDVAASAGSAPAGLPEPVAHTPHDVARAQRAEWAAAVCEGMATLGIDGDGAEELALLAAALGGSALRWDAIAWPHGLAAASSLELVGDVLGRAAGRGLRVAVAVPNTRVLQGAEARQSLGRREAEQLAAAVGGEIAAAQYLAEGALLEAPDAPERPPTARVRRDLIGDPDDAVAWLVAAGAPAAAGVAEGTLTFAPSGLAYLSRLERANDELSRANVRLARAHLGVHDAAAASVVARYEARLAEAESRNDELKGESERLANRLEIEIEVARRNDEYFQAARAKLNQRHHRIAEGLYRRTAPLRWIGRGGRRAG